MGITINLSPVSSCIPNRTILFHGQSSHWILNWLEKSQCAPNGTFADYRKPWPRVVQLSAHLIPLRLIRNQEYPKSVSETVILPNSAPAPNEIQIFGNTPNGDPFHIPYEKNTEEKISQHTKELRRNFAERLKSAIDQPNPMKHRESPQQIATSPRQWRLENLESPKLEESVLEIRPQL